MKLTGLSFDVDDVVDGVDDDDDDDDIDDEDDDKDGFCIDDGSCETPFS